MPYVRPTTETILSNTKAGLAIAVMLVGFGIAWAEYTSSLDLKADRTELRALERDFQTHTRDLEADKQVTRILLCRMPEVRPDSHCEGFR